MVEDPLGRVSDWPQSLKTTISTCLNSLYPILIWWGPDLVMLYNDAYRPILGATKHPRAMGQKGKECWPEIWHIIGPMLQGVMERGQATWSHDQMLPLDRNGYIEECYFTFSYSPIRDESGGIGGIFTAVIETTQTVLGGRRLSTLKDLAARSGEAKSKGEACRIAAETLTLSPEDIPFSLIYTLEQGDEKARLSAWTGIAPGTAESPQVIDLSASDGPWPIRDVVRTGCGQIVDQLSDLFPPIIGSVWPEPVLSSLATPILRAGQAQPHGVLISGINPRHPLDDDYRTFLEMVANQIATAISNAQAHEEEKRRAEALAEIDRAKTTFFSNVSHEFRTPLALMLGPLEDLLATSNVGLPPAAKGQLEVVNRNGLRLLRLVNTLLDFSRIEAGRVQAVYQPTDLAAFTIELASVFRAATERAGLRLTVNCPKLPEPVYVDRDMWEKVVLNLASNAFKFTSEGEIEVSLRTMDGTAELRVRDTGVGIPTEEMPRIFDRFHRVQNMRSRTHEGSGIGLALVQELIKLHGGAVRAESRLNEGTTFIVTVPLGKDHLPPDRIGASRSLASTAVGASPFVEEALRWLPEQSAIEEESVLNLELLPVPCPPHEIDENRPRIIVADDNADMRQYLARILAERYNIEAVPDGQAALAAARERCPDLILSDVMMPNLDGFGLVREIRADDALKAIPVILLSARAGEESRVEGLQQGADDYLIKPFSARELLARVGAHLEMVRIRKGAEEALRQSEARYRTLFDTMLEGFCIIEMIFAADGKPVDYRFLKINQAFEGQTGLHDAQGKLMRDLAPDHEPHWFEIYGKVALTGEPIRFVNEARALNRWYEVYAYRVGGQESRQVAIMFNDITERKNAEEAATAAHRQVQSIVDNTTSIVYAFDLEERFLLANTALAELLNSTPEKMIGKRRHEFMPKDDADWHEANDRRVIETGRALEFEEQSRLKGRSITWLTTKFPLRDAQGRIYALGGISADVSERKRAEEALRESEERLKLTLQSSAVGTFEIDLTTGVGRWNAVEYELLGLRPGDAPSDPETFFRYVHPQDVAELRARWEEATRTGRFAAEFRVIRADGQERWLAGKGKFAFAETEDAGSAGEERSPLRFLGVNFDITERKHAEEELERHRQHLEGMVQERTAELERKNRELQEFAFVAAHDLSEPLRKIQTFGDLLKAKSADHLNDQDKDYVSRMTGAASRMQELLDALLRYSRVDTKGQEFRPVKLDDIVRDSVTDLEVSIQKIGARVEIGPLPSIIGDPLQLRQLFQNLIANSLKYYRSEVTPFVGVHGEENDNACRIFVEDHGIGFDERYLDKIFQPFQRLHGKNEYSGLGIGLAICKKIVERHRGTIKARSKPGEGSTFIITLPADGETANAE